MTEAAIAGRARVPLLRPPVAARARAGARPWVESAEADGCLCCSAADLAAYLRALATAGDLLSASSAAAMKTAHPPNGPGDEPYGYGLDIHDDSFGHSGDMLGYVAHMRADMDAGIGVVAFANGLGGAWLLGEGVLALAGGREPPEPEPGDRRRSPTTAAARRSGRPTWAVFAPTTRGCRRSRSPRVRQARHGHRLGWNWRRAAAVPRCIRWHRRAFRIGEQRLVTGAPSASTPWSRH